jgi:ribosomal protein L16/L10AE
MQDLDSGFSRTSRSPGSLPKPEWQGKGQSRVLGRRREAQGRVLYEVSGITEEVEKQAFVLASKKLPLATKFVKRQEATV